MGVCKFNEMAKKALTEQFFEILPSPLRSFQIPFKTLKKDAASNIELLKHAIGVFTLDQFFPLIRLFKNVAGFLIR